MMNLIYTQVSGKLKEFIQDIPAWGVPDKITNNQLATLGYKSSNDRTIIGVLKALDLVSVDGSPTQNWLLLRNREHSRGVMARLVREAYAELFQLYPKAHSATDQQLKNFFSSRSKSGERAVQMAVATFKALVELSDFESEYIESADFVEHALGYSPALPGTNPSSIQRTISQGTQLSLSFSIAADTSPEAIEAILSGLKELMNRENE